jgi:hypothetical protein
MSDSDSIANEEAPQPIVTVNNLRGFKLHVFKDDTSAMKFTYDWLETHEILGKGGCSVIADIDDTLMVHLDDEKQLTLANLEAQYAYDAKSGTCTRIAVTTVLLHVQKKNAIHVLTSRAEGTLCKPIQKEDNLKCAIDDVTRTGIRCNEDAVYMFPGDWPEQASQSPFWYWKEQTRLNIRKVTDCCLEIGDRYWDVVTKEQKALIHAALLQQVTDDGPLERAKLGYYTLVVEYDKPLRRLGVKLGRWLSV